MASGWAKFQANYSYEPRDEREIAIEHGDHLYVAKPVEDPFGWLIGQNERTKEYGEFPGTYVAYIEDVVDFNRPPTPPPRPPKPSPRGNTPSQAAVSAQGESSEQTFVVFIYKSVCWGFLWSFADQF